MDKRTFQEKKEVLFGAKNFFSSSSHPFLGSFHFSSFAARYIETSLWDVEAKGFWEQEIRAHSHYNIITDKSTIAME